MELLIREERRHIDTEAQRAEYSTESCSITARQLLVYLHFDLFDIQMADSAKRFTDVHFLL